MFAPIVQELTSLIIHPILKENIQAVERWQHRLRARRLLLDQVARAIEVGFNEFAEFVQVDLVVLQVDGLLGIQ